MSYPIVVNETSVLAYSPANHTGTSNRRIISAATVGAHRIEVLVGTIGKSHGAQLHAHPRLEQAAYILTGEGLAEVGGEEQFLRAGDWFFFPQGMPHRFTVTSDGVLRTIVIYAPPYNEDPVATVVGGPFETLNGAASTVVTRNAPPFVPAGYVDAFFRPLITAEQLGARYLEAFELNIRAGGGKADNHASSAEQTLHVLDGELRGEVNGQPFAASAGDWVFVPIDARWTMQPSSAPGVDAIVLRAGDFQGKGVDRLVARREAAAG